MAVRLRLKRIGRRHHPVYRLAALDRRRARDSKVIEELGSYDPLNSDADRQVVLNRERIEYWLSVGAQPSDTVRRILEKQGIIPQANPASFQAS
ncbi:MAG: 30S ribosomal protein S16 [Phycisphaerae bacterium]